MNLDTISVDDCFKEISDIRNYYFFLDLMKSGDLYTFILTPNIFNKAIPIHFEKTYSVLIDSTFSVLIHKFRRKRLILVFDAWKYFCYRYTRTHSCKK